MFDYLKFSIGSMESGYKTVVLSCEGGNLYYEILRSGLLGVAKCKRKADAGEDCFTGWTALNISAWDAVYTNPDSSNGELLCVKTAQRIKGEGSHPIHGNGTNS